MPITKGAGNPDWTWDETLLALELLYRHGAPIDRSHSDVGELSSALQSAAIHPIEGRKDNFRNRDGVALKLQNLRSAIEPGHGLSSSKRDRDVVQAFPVSRRAELTAATRAIRASLVRGQPLPVAPDEEVFVEGHLVTAMHRWRDRRLRLKVLASRSDDELVCEICRYEPPALERALRESFFEAHHLVPLSKAGGSTSTRASDMSLLCAGCHRFIHRLIASRKVWVGIDEASSIYAIAGTAARGTP